MVSEVVTNAVVHGEGRIDLAIEVVGGAVRVSVSDRGRGRIFHQSMARPSEARGRGLAIVDELANSWGVVPYGKQGKTVWFQAAVS